MITEDYVSFEVAKLLKEKGFDEFCLASYNAFLSNHKVEESKVSEWGKANQIYRPTHQMAMKWLRKIYGIDIVIEVSDPSAKDRKYYCVIWKNYDSYILDLFNSYEEAVEAAFKYTLKYLI